MRQKSGKRRAMAEQVVKDIRRRTRKHHSAEARPKVANVGLVVDHDDMLAGGETLSVDGAETGVVNSPGFSHRMGKSLALAHLRPECARPGTIVQVAGEGVDTSATVTALPFCDPDKTRTHA